MKLSKTPTDPRSLAEQVRARTGVNRHSRQKVQQIHDQHFDADAGDGLDPATLAAAVSTDPARSAQRRAAQQRIDAALGA